MAAIDFNSVIHAVIDGQSVEKVYAGDVLVWKFWEGGVTAPKNVTAIYETLESGIEYQRIDWDSSDARTGLKIQEYRVSCSVNGGKPYFIGSYNGGNPAYQSTVYLQSGTYTYGIRAFTELGGGPIAYSNPLDWVLWRNGVTHPPNIKASFVTLGDGNKYIRVEWETPSVKAGVSILNYSVIQTFNSHTQSQLGDYAANSVDLPAEQLPSGTYQYSVDANTNLGRGPTSFSNILVKP